MWQSIYNRREKRKYSYDKKIKVIRIYLEGMKIRSIERVEGIYIEMD